jgi:predicted RND superfamily exporter protein
LIEADSSRGKLVLAMSGFGYEIWNADDLVRFSDEVRSLDLDHAQLGGNAFVFADMLSAIERDGPRATLLALLGSIVVVVLVLGWTRHALVTLVSGVTGTSFMLAVCTLAGMHVNFLDFVALPITIGIGVEYAVNLAARDRDGELGGIRDVLRGVGGAVALCSFTTIVGYGTLLLSENRAIRSFGEAAILGEVACLSAALVFTPAALLALAHKKLPTMRAAFRKS